MTITQRQLVAPGSILALACLIFTGACERERRMVRTRPPAISERAQLPEAPDFSAAQVVARYPDGSYSVSGLQAAVPDLIDERVQVKGFVSEIKICDPEQDDNCTLPPHAFIVDDLSRDRRPLMVIGGKYSPVTDFKVGRGETLEGKVRQVSPDGLFVSARGLLLLDDGEPPPEAQE